MPCEFIGTMKQMFRYSQKHKRDIIHILPGGSWYNARMLGKYRNIPVILPAENCEYFRMEYRYVARNKLLDLLLKLCDTLGLRK